MNCTKVPKCFLLSLCFLSSCVFSVQNNNVFNTSSNMILRPDDENYKDTISSGSIYQIALDKKNNLVYASWGYRLGKNPVAGILAFDMDSLNPKGIIKDIRDVYGIDYDEVNNRLLAEHTVSRKTDEGYILNGNSFDVIDLNNGKKIIETVVVDKGKRERDYFNSHYIFGLSNGNIVLSSESSPRNGGPKNMQRITMYNAAGHELWQSKPFPGLVAAIVSGEKIIAGANDLYEISMKDGGVNTYPYAFKSGGDYTRYMSLIQGKGVIYATSFIHGNKNRTGGEYKNIYVIEKGKTAQGFSTVSFNDSFGTGSTGVAFNSETNQLYTANFNDGTISIIDADNARDLSHYTNIKIKNAWGVNSVAYQNNGEKTDIYFSIKGGHGENVKNTEKSDDVKLAKLTIDGSIFSSSPWCRISILDIKSGVYDQQNKDCDILSKSY